MWEKLLERINYNGTISPGATTFFDLHEHHVRSVPFENQDVQNKIRIQLDLPHLFHKVVGNRRGGFCYELNHLFYHLLKHYGFKVKMISARTYDDENLGPEFDHLSLIIGLEGKIWLADVGFGDLFVTPIEVIADEVQYDGRNYFKLQLLEKSWLLLMSKDGREYEKKYQFSMIERSIVEFEDQCHWKQYNPESYFVKNSIATLPTSKGRKSIFNDKFIVKSGKARQEIAVNGPKHLSEILDIEFGIRFTS